MPVPAIQIEGLRKTYKGELGQKPFLALDDLSLTVRRGGVYAFLGPNGAGKTTTLKLLLGLMRPDAGQIRLLGHPLGARQALDKVGFLPEQPRIYGYLKGEEFLDLVARLFGLSSHERQKRIADLAERVGLAHRMKEPIRGYSRGMVQRLGLAQALINDPDLVILDEPMASLDPVGRKDFRDLILTLKTAGKTVFFSSHILSDAEHIADRIGMLSGGKLVREGEMSALLGQGLERVEVTFALHEDKWPALNLSENPVAIAPDQGLSILDDVEAANRLTAAVLALGGEIRSVTPQRRSLESLFMQELGR